MYLLKLEKWLNLIWTFRVYVISNRVSCCRLDLP